MGCRYLKATLNGRKSRFSLSAVPLQYLKSFGYGGVDIFFFASGIGCFFSLDKNHDAFSFLKRRVERIVPTYMIILIPYLIVSVIIAGMSLRDAFGDFLGVQFFTERESYFNVC